MLKTAMSNTYTDNLIKKLYKLQQLQKYTDVAVIIHELQFFCHKVVLAAASDVFATMFDAEMKEKSQGIVDLSELDVDSNAFRQFLMYLYTGDINITIENVEDILVISNFLLVEKLRVKCFKYLERILSPQNCLNVAILADKFGYKKLFCAAEKVICQNFMTISLQETFLELDLHYVRCILSNDNLEIPNENSVLLSCFNWLYHDFDKRMMVFQNLIESCVRLKYLSSDELAILENVKKQCSCNTVLIKENEFKEVNPRSCLDTCSVVISTGGYDGNKCLMTSFFFSPDEKKWSHMAPMKLSRHDHGAVVLKNTLIVIGGFNTIFGPLENVESFNPIRNEWFEMPSLSQKRKSHAVCIFEGKMFVSGGLDGNYNVLSSTEYFNENSQRWERAPSMIEGRYTHGLVANDKHIFAIGGWKSNSCEYFDGFHWNTMVSMKNQRAGASCSIYRNKIYVYGGYSEETCLSSLEIFDIEKSFWIEGPSSKVCRWRAGSTVIGDDIFIVGGRDSTWQYLDSVETYSLEKNTWSEREALPFKVMGLKCCLLNVPRKKLRGNK